MQSKMLAIILVSIFVLLTFLPVLTNSTTIARTSIFESIIKPNPRKNNPALFQIYVILFGYNIGSGDRPKYVYSEPDVIEIGYLDNISTEVIFGNPLRNLSGYQKNVNYETIISFDYIIPDNIPENAFLINFDPPVINLREYHDQKVAEGYNESGKADNPIPNPRSKMYIKCEIPYDPQKPIEDFILTINMTYKAKYRNMWETKAFGTIPGQNTFPEFAKRMIELFPWFKTRGYLGTIGFIQAFGETSQQSRYGEVFVKMKSFRYAEMDLIENQPISMRLNDMHMAQVNIQNRGNYPEQYGFRIKKQNGSLTVNTPSPITLYPGESRTVQIGLITKPITYDRGTLHSINIELFSNEKPNETIANSTITVRTQGFSPQNILRFQFSWHTLFIISIIILIFIILGIYRHILKQILNPKPRKPWILPEEKQHLQKLLQKKDKKTYEHELTMMKQEYQSALLTHKTQLKHDLKQLRKQSRIYQLFRKIRTVPKLPKPQPKPKKEKPKKKPPTKTKSVTKPKKPKQKNTKPVKPTLSKDIQKQQLMEKIKKQQINSR